MANPLSQSAYIFTVSLLMNKKKLEKMDRMYSLRLHNDFIDSILRCFRLCHFIALAPNKLRIAIVNLFKLLILGNN